VKVSFLSDLLEQSYSTPYAPVPPEDLGYDNYPSGEMGTHPLRSINHWRINIEHVDQVTRDNRVLSEAVEYFLEACGKYPPLDDDEIKKLLRQYLYNGDLEARGTVVRHNLRLVVHEAKKVRRDKELPPRHMEELLQDGVLGLMRATEKVNLDHESGAKFSTYAIHWIRNTILRGYADNYRTIRLPVHVIEKLEKVSRTFKDLRKELKRNPTEEEVAVQLDMSVEDLDALYDSTKVPSSLDEIKSKSEDDEWQNRYDTLVDEEDKVFNQAEDIEQKFLLREALETLQYRERRVLELRYGLGGEHPRNLDEIGRTFNITRERIRQIEISALQKLEATPKAQKLRKSTYDLTPEDARRRTVESKWALRHETFVDYLADKARACSASIAKQKELNEQEKQEEAKRQKLLDEIGEKFENATYLHAVSRAVEAGGKLLSRVEFFEQRGAPKPPCIARNIQNSFRTNNFIEQYGHFAGAIFDLLYKGLQALTKDGDPVSITALEEYVSDFDDSLYDVRPEFLTSVLEAAERRGHVIVDRSKAPITYRVRRIDDEEQRITFASNIEEEINPKAAIILHLIKQLRAGSAPDTAITFAQLRSSWAEISKDLNETQLRWSLTYLERAGHIAIKASKIRGHDIWRSTPNGITPMVKPQDLWYGDK
jgi:RNA polymerase primary sigma factor